jgi:hypothetical protein
MAVEVMWIENSTSKMFSAKVLALRLSHAKPLLVPSQELLMSSLKEDMRPPSDGIQDDNHELTGACSSLLFLLFSTFIPLPYFQS